MVKRKKNLKSQKRKADKFWSDEIKKRDKICQICGSIKSLNAHHIIPRTIGSGRYDFQNGLTLCTYCHKWNRELSPHQNALGFTLWLKKKRPEIYDYILNKYIEND